MADPALAALLGGLLGAVFGSYLATLLVRWPQGQSTSTGRSRCDGCGRTLAWFELVPMLSYAVLRGRCRTCAAPIEARLPAMELLCAACGGAAFGLGMPLFAPLAWVLVALAVFDDAYLWLPDRLVAVAAVLALVIPPLDPAAGIGLRLLGGVAGFGVLALTAAVFRKLTGRVGMGGGDPKLFGAIGLWAGILALPQVLLGACAIGIGDYVVRRVAGGGKPPVEMPFGTYLCATAIVMGFLQPIFDLRV